MARLGADPEREARAAERACGACSLCCTLLRVDELGKPAGERCVHQLEGGGCGIYDERPAICRRYRCLWRQGGLGDDERPDVTGGVVDLTAVGAGVRLDVRVARRRDFDGSTRLRAIAERHRGEMPVRVSDVEDVSDPDRPFEVLLADGASQRVAGEWIDDFRDGVHVGRRRLPWADRWARRVAVWWRSRGLG